MRPHRLTAPVLAFAALYGGVAATASGQGSGATRANDRAEVIAAAATPVRWEAFLRPTMQRSGRVVVTTQNKATGSLFISQAGQDMVRVRLTVSASYLDGSNLKWAILPGRCGSNMMAIAPVDQFPSIEISTNGRGEVDRVLTLSIPATGQFHVNVYMGAAQLENVLTCGNLNRSN